MRSRASSTETSPGGREKQRSRTGCKTCRSRKVKCDERPGGCYNCSRLNLPCPNSAAYHEAIQNGEIEGDYLRTQAGLRRSRTYRSCRSCRTSKSRCSGERPACVRCRQRGIECRYDGKQAPAWLEAASNEADARNPVKGERSSSSGPMHSHPSSPALSHTDTNSSHYFQEATPEPPPYEPFSWLLAPELPQSHEHIVELVEAFFVNMHSLRFFGFIHKPSVMRHLEQWSYSWYENQDNSLLLAVCALGAKYCALKYEQGHNRVPERLPLAAGCQWAQKAQQLVTLHLNSTSIEATMAIVLLHQHELRVGNYTNAFVLTGLGVRMAQALQLNIETSSADIGSSQRTKSITTAESKRRLMWSIYIMDTWVGSGVGELTLLDEADIRIQLPCSDRNFIAQQSQIVETLRPDIYSPFAYLEEGSPVLLESADLQGEFIRLVSLRRKVLSYVKNLHQSQQPWAAASRFHEIHGQLKLWVSKLPSTLRFSQNAIYERKQASQLGGLLFCHVTFHQTMCDLMRVAVQQPFGDSGHVHPSLEQAAFLNWVQDQRFEHCMAICALFEEAMRHGHSTLADTWLSVVAHDSAKFIIEYVYHGMGSSTTKGDAFKVNAISAVHSNIRALHTMIPLHSIAQSLHSATLQMLIKAGLPSPPPTNAEYPSTVVILENENTSAVDQQSLDQDNPKHVLNPLAVSQTARQNIRAWRGPSPDFGSCAGSASPEERPATPADDQGIYGPMPPDAVTISELSMSISNSSSFSPYPMASPVPATMFHGNNMTPSAYDIPMTGHLSASALRKPLPYYDLGSLDPNNNCVNTGRDEITPPELMSGAPPFLPDYTNVGMHGPSMPLQISENEFSGVSTNSFDTFPSGPSLNLMDWAM
ncbi:fungal-specific transcription factor domain-domain-containing protein [Coniella lustricola]|uniref:Fungal-specific transcription factor domain-domain-containing protein n=1 Tax=Coniella lustricola TaxID=2025994 RepID=A0A2T3AG92_9PEZI|nr:fungal-specific transcription factor domain-domain-containing protein [Coniella lustricola]